MKTVVVGFGSAGDTQPLVALSNRLVEGGHEVALVADAAAAAGLAEGVELHVVPLDAQDAMATGQGWWAQAMASGRAPAGMLGQMSRLCASWLPIVEAAADHADVLVSLAFGLAPAASAGHDRGIPVIPVHLQPALPTAEFMPAPMGDLSIPRWLNLPVSTAFVGYVHRRFTADVNAARARLGKPRLPRLLGPWPHIGAWSPTLLPAPTEWARYHARLTGQWRQPADASPQVPQYLRAFLEAGEPPVYLGFGSMTGFAGMTELRDAFLDGLSHRRVILSGGWADLTSRDLPENVLASQGWVPHEWLFPRCAAIAHHCGAGTTHQAAASGTPSIPVPFTLDQPFWAGRLHTLGIASGRLDPRKPDPAAVREAVAQATSATLRGRARVVAAQMAAEPDGTHTAVEVIERVVAAVHGRV
ncbi:MAG: glycosyltransferase [Arachnia sp.]